MVFQMEKWAFQQMSEREECQFFITSFIIFQVMKILQIQIVEQTYFAFAMALAVEAFKQVFNVQDFEYETFNDDHFKHDVFITFQCDLF